MKKISSSIISVILVILFIGCGSTNSNKEAFKDLTPTTIYASKKVFANQSFDLSIDDNRCIDCVWEEEDGKTIKNGKSITWKAPSKPGEYKLIANITENSGARKIVKFNITVVEPQNSTQNENNSSDTNSLPTQDQSEQNSSNESNNSTYNDNYDIPDNAIKIVDSKNSTPPNMNLHDPTPSGAYYEYIYDDEIGGYTLKLHSHWIENSYHILGYDVNEKYVWNEHPEYQNKLHISWDAKFSGDYIVFVVMGFKTADGEYIEKDLVYTPTPNGYENFTGSFMQIYLPNSNDGKWHHYERDLLKDVRKFYPGATINYAMYKKRGEVNGFAVRGSGYITNIFLW